MILTFPMIAWGVGLGLGWTVFLLGAIKWLLNRQITAFETRVVEADAKAAKALASLSEYKQQSTHEMASMRLEFSQKLVCGNHPRMEKNDQNFATRVDQLHGSIKKIEGIIEGRMEGIGHALNMIQQHLIGGGK